MVIGRVVAVHIDDAALTADGRVDVLKIRPIARLGLQGLRQRRIDVSDGEAHARGAGARLAPNLSLPDDDSVVAEGRRSLDSPWVRGPVWDSVWMLSALWLVPVAWWLSRADVHPEEGPLDLLYFGLTALFWLGHR